MFRRGQLPAGGLNLRHELRTSHRRSCRALAEKPRLATYSLFVMCLLSAGAQEAVQGCGGRCGSASSFPPLAGTTGQRCQLGRREPNGKVDCEPAKDMISRCAGPRPMRRGATNQLGPADQALPAIQRHQRSGPAGRQYDNSLWRRALPERQSPGLHCVQALVDRGVDLTTSCQ